jgi:hypothetical protein
MYLQNKLADFSLRVVVGLVIGLLFGFLLSEASYFFTPGKQSADRQPQEVTLVIPYGTAKQVEAGVYNRSLPSDMVFVQGDILIVKNEDDVPHQLGPLWVPANTSSALKLETVNEYSYECTFQPTKFMGLDVRPSVTASTRLEAILAIGLPTGMMLALYSYMLPGRKKSTAPESDLPAGGPGDR